MDLFPRSQRLAHNGMPCLMERDAPSLVLADDPRFLLGSGNDLVDRFLHLFHGNVRSASADREQRALVQQVFQVSPGESSRFLGNCRKRDTGYKRLVRGMYLEDLLAPPGIRKIDNNAPVEATRTQQRRVQHIRPVGCSKDDNALVCIEAIHLDQQLVQRLFALVVAAADACAAMAPDRIDFINEHDTWSVLLRLREEVAHAAGAHTDKHLDELRSGDIEEWHLGFARDGTRKQCLSAAGRSDEQGTLGDRGAHGSEFLGALEILNELARLFLGLIQSCDVLERHARAIVHEQLGLALAKPEYLVVLSALHALHHEDPESDQEHIWQNIDQQRYPDAGLHLVEVPLHALFDEQWIQAGIIQRRDRRELRSVFQCSRARLDDIGDLKRDVLHVPGLNLGDEIRVAELCGLGDWRLENRPGSPQDHKEQDPPNQFFQQVRV